MKPIILDLNNSDKEFLYIQLYEAIRDDILSGAMSAGEKLPSLRSLSSELGISVTTTGQAYDQLLVEGYIFSKPQSGYYVAQVNSGKDSPSDRSPRAAEKLIDYTVEEPDYLYDLNCFDFGKWKKCAAKVFNDYSRLLLFESDPQGEPALRYEISRYIYRFRGVNAHPDNIVIGAGTQQITSHLSRILTKMDIHHVSLEAPGYLPVQSMFRDGGFTVSHIPVASDGIDIGRLPTNISSAVYVSPSNQFPTGAVMPAGRRYQLLDWANANNSIIIEDDYDSELRYFGKPVPAMQGLDKNNRVVYLGSFSSTLFPAVKISYMVLPDEMAEIFRSIKSQYTQTCSKSEQLTLALFMEEGHYYTGIRKLRSLYSQKLQAAVSAFTKHGGDMVRALDTQSGINLTLKVRSRKPAEELCSDARALGLHMVPLSDITDQETSALIFYYNQVPLEKINDLIKQVVENWIFTC
ncbi:MAG: PLP-dependent aminotransferase family protein [Firmicutes bacterium]|nr:PLP-dependent aminotransferase family protein [Bacillota bacterium]